jgi:hypothetical protein
MTTPGYLDIVNGNVTRVPPATVPTANGIPGLDGAGLLPLALMPAGTQLQTHVATVGGSQITAGMFVNIDSSTGLARPADAATGYPAMMFSLSLYEANATNAVFYLLGKNTEVTLAGNYRGRVWLGTGGGFVTTPPQVGTGGVIAGHLFQRLGTAFGTYIAFEFDEYYVLNV